MKIPVRQYFSLGMILGVVGLALPAQAASFQGLGFLPSSDDLPPFSYATGVSADGSVVVGYQYYRNSSRGDYAQAFRWTASDGMVGLGSGSGGRFASSYARAVSADGSVIVGESKTFNRLEAFRWTQATGIVNLGTLPGAGYSNPSYAYGVSADGSVVVGGSSYDNRSYGENRYLQAFRWTQETGMVGLGGSITKATGVSADGSVIVGESRTFDRGAEAFRWTQQTGIVGLGGLPTSPLPSYGVASGISADARVIIGNAYFNQAVRWTASGIESLGALPFPPVNSTANAVSSDGSVIVGSSFLNVGEGGNILPTANIWKSTSGLRNLQEVLVSDFGLNLNGWKLYSATGISADGLTIVGYGSNPNGRLESWIANLGSNLGNSPNNPFLPTSNPSNPNGFTFSNISITPEQTFFFDPDVAVGYSYAVSGGPRFASVLIPASLPGGDREFVVSLPGVGSFPLFAGTPFDFLQFNPLGFDDFQISGINTNELLNPIDPLAFVTGLTFTGAGTVTVTQNPIVQNVSNPITTPESSNLLSLGLIGLGLALKRRRYSVADTKSKLNHIV